MAEFDTSLLREKFTITEVGPSVSDAPPVIALSNRMVIEFANKKGEERETFSVRAQNMHTCIRLAAAIAREHAERGPITWRTTEFRWDHLWIDVIKRYEKDWNPDIWCAVYMNGRVIFADGHHHPFLDVIEHCAANHKGDYTGALPLAEQAFQQAGKLVKIDYDSNVALLVKVAPDEAKCGIVLRSPSKKTTFSFKALRKKDDLRVPSVLLICAAFLEGVQLTFQIGLLNHKYRLALFEKFSDDHKRMERSTTRLGSLNRAILQFGNEFTVNYRPEQPDFQRHIKESEALAARMIKPAPVEEKV